MGEEYLALLGALPTGESRGMADGNGASDRCQ